MLFPAQDNPLQLPLKKCAVVGNSGILRHSKCGQDIDQADFIMRWEISDCVGLECKYRYVHDYNRFIAPSNVNQLCPREQPHTIR